MAIAERSVNEPGRWRRRLLLSSVALNVVLLAVLGYFIATRGGVEALWTRVTPKAPVPLDWDPKAIEHFKNFPHEPHATVLLGDSITHEAPFAEYFSNLRMRAVGGDTSKGLLSRLDEAIENSPDRVFINIGTNDFSKGVEPDELLGNYKKIIERVKAASPAARIYVISILPINLSFGDSPRQRTKQANIVTANKALAAFSQSTGVYFIDAHAKMVDNTGNLQQSMTWDGLHLNWTGYQVYCTAIHDFVKQQEQAENKNGGKP